MTPPDHSYTDDLHARLRDPTYAANYLNAVLEDAENDEDTVLLIALRHVAEASLGRSSHE